ncbi:hypothetical protein [Mycolicibacterium sp.]|uniref:hypothetical protein n=1 Tax=Mycolicibacterium sp. TaxID=2320850 RepID=UPI001D1CB1A6|nr:hypothetical protein [Mycolicibacterium sp.]MCB1290282.1 hypothetical protein [Mycobacterium sp.]MCB9409205.1 hypothetical protein [Mycolicibacterium sp.]
MTMISVRSHFAAGTAAVVGAGAIALTPALPGQPLSPAALPVPAVAEIALTGFSLPATDIIGVLQTLGGLGGTIDGLLSVFLPDQLVNAVFTEVAGQALPLLTTAAGDVLGYLGTAVTGLLVGSDSIPARIGAAMGDIPTVLTSAVTALSAGDLAAAVQTVTTGLAAPLTEVGQTLADAVEAFQGFLNAELNSVVNELPGIILAAIQTVVGGSVAATLESITSTFSGLLGGLFPAAATPGLSLVPNAEVQVSVSTAPRAAAAGVPVHVSPAQADTVRPDPVAEIGTQSEAEAVDTVAPAGRSRAAALRPDVAGSAPSVSAEVTRAKQRLRARAGDAKPAGPAAARVAR